MSIKDLTYFKEVIAKRLGAPGYDHFIKRRKSRVFMNGINKSAEKLLNEYKLKNK